MLKRYLPVALIALIWLLATGGAAHATPVIWSPHADFGHGQTGIGSSPTGHSQLQARIALMPQGLKSVLRHGILLRVTSNESADGFAKIAITRALAKRAGIKAGRGPEVVIGRGTVSGVKSGTIHLRLGLSHNITTKLSRLRHATLTLHLKLVASGGQQEELAVAGRY